MSVPIFKHQPLDWYPRFAPRLNPGNRFARKVHSLWLLHPRNNGYGYNLMSGNAGSASYQNGVRGWSHGAWGLGLDSAQLSRFSCSGPTVSNQGQLTHLMVYVNAEDIDTSVDDSLTGWGLATGSNPGVISSSLGVSGGVATGAVAFSVYGTSQDTLDTTHPWDTRAGAVHAVIGGIYDGEDVKRCAANGRFIGEAFHGGRWTYTSWSGHVFKSYNSSFFGANTRGVFSAIWLRPFSAVEMCDITANPWQIFA